MGPGPVRQETDREIQEAAAKAGDMSAESYGYEMHQPKGGSSHCTFRKERCRPVTIPKHEPIKKVYVEMVKEVIESEVDTDDAE